MKYEEFEAIIEKLSYSMQMKTARIMELKVQLKGMPIKLTGSAGASVLSGAYIVNSYKYNLDSTLSTFGTSNNLFLNMKSINVLGFAILAFGGLCFYSTLSTNKKKSEEYEALRKDIMKTINSGFCKCNVPCNCREDYIKAMEKLGIQLAF